MNTKLIAIIIAIAVLAGAAVMLVPRIMGPADDTNAEATAPAASDTPVPETSGDTPDATETPETDGPFAGSPPATDTGTAIPAIRVQLDEAARQVNAEAPVTIDPLTRLTAASVSGNRLRYRYELLRPLRTGERERMEQQFPGNSRRALCDQVAIRALITQGAQFEYVYYGTDGAFIFNTVVTSC